MDPTAVAAFYRAKGYTVHEGVRAPGLSGNEHRVPLMAEGPLGSLAIFFGDFGGVDGPEMGGARKVARDLGATPVLAADTFSNQDRQMAARLGVVLLDSDALADEEEPMPESAWPGLQSRPVAPDGPETHPWPASGRVGGRDGPGTRAIDVDDLLASPRRRPEPEAEADEPLVPAAPAEPRGDDDGLWKRPRVREPPAPRAPRTAGGPRFGWLGIDVPPKPAAEAIEYADVVPARAGISQASATVPRREPGHAEVPITAPGEAILADARKLRKQLLWAFIAAVAIYLFWLWWHNPPV